MAQNPSTLAGVSISDRTSIADRWGVPRLPFHLAAQILLFVGVERWVMYFAHMPQRSYEQPILIAELARNIGVIQLLVLGAAAALLIRYCSLGRRWAAMEGGTVLRWFVVVTAGLLAWPHATYGYNLFFDRGHYLDRLLLPAMVAMIWWRPAFVLPFVVLAVAVIGQLSHPLGGAMGTVDGLIIRLAILFFCTLVWSGLSRREPIADYVFLASCLIASCYWWPGAGKLRLNWLAHGHPSYLFPAAYANGWLAFLAPSTVSGLTRSIANFDWLMRCGALVLECGALVCLCRRWTFLAFLGGWIAFHALNFLLIGYCFWQWVAVELALGLVLASKRHHARIPIFTRGHFVISVLVIGGSCLWFRPTNLAWYETRLCYTFRYEVETAGGRGCTLLPRFFSPYGDVLTMGAFGYLAETPCLVEPYGVTFDRAVASELADATSPRRIWSVEADLGDARFRAAGRDRFKAFLERYLANFNARGSGSAWWSVFQPPPVLWSLPRANTFDGAGRIRTIRVYHVTSLYDGVQYGEIRKRLVLTVDVPRSPKK